ncbi:MAG: ABC transporter substrate-binding protein, partial [Candidatus Bathyarchaeota archaeon]
MTVNPYNYAPVGTGPFKHVEWFEGINWTLARNEAYFKGSPNIDGLLLRWDITLENLETALINNEIDLIPGNAIMAINPSNLTIIEQMPGMTTTLKPEFGFVHMIVNFGNPFLNNINVRQAIASAINKTEIITNVFSGYANSSTGPIPPAAGYWYNPNVTKYDFNLTRAEELLNQTYPIDPETGYRFNISLKVPEWDPLIIQAAQLIENWLQQININATLSDPLDSYQFYLDLYVDHDFDLAINELSLISGFDPDLFALFHTGARWNGGNYSNSYVDLLLEQGRATNNV